MRNKYAQQEMVGFILIVVLVIIALMVFLVISANKPLVTVESKPAQGMLSSVLAYTTDCIVSEPNRENMMELIIDCHENKKCANMNKMSCEYLNETLPAVMKSLTDLDVTITAYTITAYWGENEDKTLFPPFPISSGNCVGGSGSKLQGEIEPLNSELSVLLELCTESLDS